MQEVLSTVSLPFTKTDVRLELPTISLLFSKKVIQKIPNLLGNVVDGGKSLNIHTLLCSYGVMETEKLFVKRTGRRNVELRIPGSVGLAKLRFSADMGEGPVQIQSVRLVQFNEEQEALELQRDEMIIACRVDIASIGVLSSSGRRTVLAKLVREAEEQRREELDSYVGWYSDKLPQMIKEAEKQNFKFTSQSSMLIDRGQGIIELTLSPDDVITHSTKILECKNNNGSLDITIKKKTIIGRILKWQEEDRTMRLKLERCRRSHWRLFSSISGRMDAFRRGGLMPSTGTL